MSPLEIGHERYETIDFLGVGSFGSVVLAWDKVAKEKVAVKLLPRGPQINKRVQREVLNHSRLWYPHVIEFKECFLTPQHLCIVMEYAPGGDLRKFVHQHHGLDESLARWLFQQLILTLDYCHKMGVVNRDIKLENMLLANSDRWPLLKMCDFGFSKDAFKSDPDSLLGTRVYTAPEILELEEERKYDGEKADIWSSGVLLHLMVFNSYPFITRDDLGHSDTGQRIRQSVLNNRLLFREDKHASPALKDLLKRMLEKNPERRISVDGIMNHLWFRHQLPKNAFEMNEDTEIVTQGPQSEEEIKAIVAQAVVPHSVEATFYEELGDRRNLIS